MTHKLWVISVSFIVATSPSFAAGAKPTSVGPAPTDRADVRYCLRVAPATGSLVETTRCWTRAQWVEQGVDVDKEWAKEGVSVRQ